MQLEGHGLSELRWRTGDRELLATRLCDLRYEIATSLFAPQLANVDREIRGAGLALRPNFYLCTGYGCVVRTVNVGILFTDGFAPTRRIARSVGMRVRGGAAILRTLRHEVGHAFCYAHRLHETACFRELFGVDGDFYDSYPDEWRPTPAALTRVRRGEIIGVYAGRHADEDFAVCFQTWLADPANCMRPYRRRPLILKKLAYVADVASRLGRRKVANDPADLDEPLAAVEVTLRDWLDEVRRTADYTLFPKGPVA
jgi:hypothetical protein